MSAAHPETTRATSLLRQAALAMAVFLAMMAVLGGPSRSYQVAVLAAGAAVANASGSSQDVAWARGRWQTIDRHDALAEFFRDPQERPSCLPIFGVWSWIAVAPAVAFRRRVGFALAAVGVVAPVSALAYAVSALAWYRGSASMTLGTGTPAVDVLGVVANLLSLASVYVLPIALAVAAYPGLRSAAPRLLT